MYKEINLSLLPPLDKLKIPVIGSPLFIISNPDLVIAQCKAGIIGSFPCLNAREGEGEPNMLEIWLKKINEELDRFNQINPDNPAAPYAVNHIVHKSNVRLEKDIDICAKWNAPVWITSLGARPEVNNVAHQANGIVLHDIIDPVLLYLSTIIVQIHYYCIYPLLFYRSTTIVSIHYYCIDPVLLYRSTTIV